MKKTVAPYGKWVSPITAELASGAIISFQDVVIDGPDIYWSEMRPFEGGRYAIVKASPNGKQNEMLLPEFNARTRVHEYGGAAFTVWQGTLYFTNFADQRLYRQRPNGKPEALTAPGIRFADMTVTPYGIVAIAESHHTQEPKNFLALIHPESGEVKELVSGYDFYSSPAVSKDFKQIAWICWQHPNMPWDDTELWVANFSTEGLSELQRIDAVTNDQAFFQPQWGPNNELVVVSDKSNWWNLYRVVNQSLEPLFTVESEIGQPLWNLGASTWTFTQEGILCTFHAQGMNRLFLFKNNQLKDLELPYHQFSQIRSHGEQIAFIGAASDKPAAVLAWCQGQYKILKENTQLKIDVEYLSQPEHISFPSSGRQAHAIYYAPKNKLFEGLPQTCPPLIVKSHGGPTANCGANLNLDIQYFTSRGFAVVDVNYAGSTGYGRQYRKSLEGNWGIYDIQDCQAAALYLAQQGKADPNKLAITGGSAGGYTTLAALTFTDTFHVGASLYGVSDLEALVKETHKFESRYLDRLIGPYPQEKAKYVARSPIHHIAQLASPVIFFQGEEDKIVPPNQAQSMYEALIKKGITTRYCLFPQEQHGFRKAENRIRVLQEQEQFFSQVLKLG